MGAVNSCVWQKRPHSLAWATLGLVACEVMGNREAMLFGDRRNLQLQMGFVTKPYPTINWQMKGTKVLPP